MSKIEVTKRRSFGGKTSGFKDKDERDFEQKHLQAYIKGKPFFRHRYKTVEEEIMGQKVERRIPAYYPTKEIWT